MVDRQPIEWSEILGFLEQRQPGSTADIRGATEEEIAQLADHSPVPLPADYVEFMRHFGGARGDFNILTEHCYLAQELLSIPEDIYVWDRRRYLLIGMLDESPRLDTHELFFDLYQADSRDAQVVGFTPCDEPSIYELECGITDRTIGIAMVRFVFDQAPVRATMIMGNRPKRDTVWVCTRVRETASILSRMGFARCLPETPYTWAGQRGDDEFCLVQADAEHEAVFVDVVGPARVPVARVAAVLEDTVEAELQQLVDET